MQSRSFRNETVNRNATSKHIIGDMLISQSHMVLFSLHSSVFNDQVCSFKGWPRRRRPWRSKSAGTLESNQTFSGCRQSVRQWPQFANITVILSYIQSRCKCCLWWLYMLHLHSWIQQLSDYPWIIHKIHSPFMECCGCSSQCCCKLECCITVCHGWSQSKVGSRAGGRGDRGFFLYLFIYCTEPFNYGKMQQLIVHGWCAVDSKCSPDKSRRFGDKFAWMTSIHILY